MRYCCYIILPLLLLILLNACTKDYEKVPLENVTIEYIFDKDDSLGTNARKFLNSIYAALPPGFNRIDGDVLDAASDDAISSLPGVSEVQKLATGGYTALRPIKNEMQWAAFYSVIRSTSLFVSNIGIVPVKETLPNGLSAGHAWKSEARFLRAFAYFGLLKRYGGIPLMGDQVRQLGDDVQLPRNTFAECVHYIVSECDAIKDSLRSNPVDNPALNSHRVTRGAALALKARVLLYAASPLFNGGNIDPQNPLTGYTDYSRERWQLAADAARDVINSNAFALLNNYKDVFTTQNNSEVIFFRQGGNNTDVESANGPVGITAAQAFGRTSPTQELVDAFPMLDGKPITDPASGYDPLHPYNNRDPRLQMNILYNGAPWVNTIIETFEGGANKPGGATQQTKTGYYMRKFMGNFESATQYSSTSHDWVYFRYAEVLLNYAEAQNEFAGPSEDVYQALAQLRRRAGITEGTDGGFGLKPGMSRDEMRATIRNERRVELAFEEHRFWDIRRWKIAEQVANRPLHGMLLVRIGAGLTYNVVEVFTPVFATPRMYLFPIPYDEVVKNDNMRQNPGW